MFLPPQKEVKQDVHKQGFPHQHATHRVALNQKSDQNPPDQSDGLGNHHLRAEIPIFLHDLPPDYRFFRFLLPIPAKKPADERIIKHAAKKVNTKKTDPFGPAFLEIGLLTFAAVLGGSEERTET